MTRVGLNLASEAHGPDELVEYAVRAEDAGFDFAVISDHFHPWVGGQGESPFVWSTLGAIARETTDLRVGTAVTCPTIRIHPAVVAQATATVAAMFDGRFFFGVGTGENLNEHVIGERWPEHEVRLAMLEEAVDVIRKLWTGGNVSHHGEHYTVENAKLFTLPDEPPDVVVSGLGPKTAAAAGEFGDGFVATSPKEELLRRYADAGGDGPRYGGTKVSWAESEAEARANAHEWWPNVALTGGAQDLPTPKHFESAVEMVSEDDVAEQVVTGDDPDDYLDEVRSYVDAGFDRVYLHQTGPNQRAFIEFAGRELIPEVA